MPVFYFLISDGIQKEIEIDATDPHDAVNTGLNALSQYAFKHFPPPERIAVHIHDENREHVATLTLGFEIAYGKGIKVA